MVVNHRSDIICVLFFHICNNLLPILNIFYQYFLIITLHTILFSLLNLTAMCCFLFFAFVFVFVYTTTLLRHENDDTDYSEDGYSEEDYSEDDFFDGYHDYHRQQLHFRPRRLGDYDTLIVVNNYV